MRSLPESKSHPFIPPSAYTQEYFLGNVEGHREFVTSGGRLASARFQYALNLGRVRPGDLALDIGCGRGEIVVQATMRGAFAVGVDYAMAAVSLAHETLRTLQIEGGHVSLASGSRLPFRSSCFDVAFLLDVVEHLTMAELAAFLAELRRVLRRTGRLVIHTSPNRLFEQVMYPRYVRHIHRLALGLARLARFGDGLFNPVMLPTDLEFPHDEYERTLHITAHSPESLSRILKAAGFRVCRLDFWEPSEQRFYESRRLNLEVRLLDVVRYLKPLSNFPPLNRFFKNHIWMVAEPVDSSG